jgi:amino acid adenylation domain-containing protein
MDGPEFRSLVELLLARSSEQPERVAYTFLAEGEREESRLTYRQLDTLARVIGASLQASGLQGERALLLYPPGLDFIAAFWGCLYASTVAVPAYPPKPRQPDPRVHAIARDARPRVVLSSSAALPRLQSAAERLLGLGDVAWIATDTLPPGLAGDWRRAEPRADTPAFLQYTSGSTSQPKGVIVSHGNLLHNQEMIRRAFGQSPATVVVGWLPLYHDMGLIGNVLQPLYAGGTCILMPPMAFLQRPLRWLAAIARYRGTTSGGPNFAYELCVRKIAPEERAALDLSSWHVAFSGAEPVRPETLDRFAEAFAPCGFRRAAFYPCYGLAEATLFVTGGALAAPPEVRAFDRAALEQGRVAPAEPTDPTARRLVGCGGPWAGQELAVVDPASGEEQPPGRVGEIWVSGPSVGVGYWNRPELTEATFHARLGERGPCLRTGDLGFLSDGELFVTGRLKDLIILRGRNHYPEDLEVVAEGAHAALRPGCNAAFAVEADGEERLVVVLELDRRTAAEPGQVLDAVRRAVTEVHEVQVHEVVLVRAGTVPKTSSGKVRRHACRAAYERGELEVVARSGEAQAGGDTVPLTRETLLASPRGERLAALTEFLRHEAARVARVSPEGIDATRPLGGLDSLAALELRNAVEAALGAAPSLTALLAGASPAELAAELLDGLAIDSRQPLCPAPEPPAEFALSFGQRALWYLERLAPASAAYNIAIAGRAVGGLDSAALLRAVETLTAFHPALRTTFHAPQGEPFQRVHDRLDPEFLVEDVSSRSDAAVLERLHEIAFRPFDLERGLFRVAVLERREGEPFVLFALHHLAADLWSFGTLAGQLAALYGREIGGAAVPAEGRLLRYSDFVAWQRALLQGPEGERLWSWWQERLSHGLRDLDLPTDRPRLPVQTHHGGTVRRRVTPETADRLRALARREGATLHSALLAAFEVVLYRHSGQADFQVGVPVSARTRAELADLVGYLINVVVVRATADGSERIDAYLRRAQREVTGALEHQDFPFPLLAERLQPARDASRSPLFQALFSLQRAAAAGDESLAALALGERGTTARLGGLLLDPLPLDRRPAQFDLALEMAEVGGGLAAVLRYNTDLFDAVTAERLLARLSVLLAGIAAAPDAPLDLLPLLAPEERWQLLSGFNPQAGPLPEGWRLSIPALVAVQAARTPTAVAVESVGGSAGRLTYAELEGRSNQLAHHLLRLGVRPEEPVALCTERSPAMVVALLAVLKAGAAYVPLDATYPRERLAYMLQDGGVGTVLTERDVEGLLPPGPRTLRLDAGWERVAQERDTPPDVDIGPEHLAYTIYTSGSTGRPKGVEIRHGGVVRFLAAMRREPGLAAGDVLLSVTTLSFDIAALELLLPLAVGARVVLASRETVADGRRLAEAIRRCAATAMQATPATWRLLLESGWAGEPGLKILCGGEALPRQIADQLLERGASVWNLYGPTETTIWSTCARVLPGAGPVPIGRPIDGTRVYVLGGSFEPVPPGATGELLIGGAGVARGYHGRPDLTAERFVPDPWGAAGDRLYRTGDLARWLPDGRIQFLGRRDHQVKLRGHRVELGEIESCLASHPSVREAVVMAREDRPGDQRLVAYLVPDGAAPTTSELRAFLRERLPEPLVPGSFVVVQAWPLTPNGKVDRKALPPPAGVEARPHPATLRPGLERRIAGVWREVLGLDRVGANDNFFDLGGHSLLLGRVQARLREELGVEVSMIDLLRHPTVAALGGFLGGERGTLAPVRARPTVRTASGDLAIIAMSGRFPGAGDVERFWSNLRQGVESITFFGDGELRAAGVGEDLLADPSYVKAGGVLDGIELFDAGLFGFTPREAEALDPQHRLFLECAREALECAGYDPDRYRGTIGVWAGVGLNSYLLHNVYGNRAFLAAIGSYQAFISNDKDFVPTRASYKLNLRGPSVNVQTACSSSLVAVHLARQALLLGECDMALAGGVSVAVPHGVGYLHQEGGILSPDGHCRAFDAAARGTVRGNGVGVVMLKRLEDALADGDTIRAVVKGSAINNDGSGKVGYTAPSIDGQAQVVAAALAAAAVEPGSIGYVEAHGTGTELGDPVEVAALTQAFRAAGEERNGFCAIGSVKSNIGHLDTAAGVAGLIKAALVVERGELPPTLHFHTPNPKIGFAASPFRPSAALCGWPPEMAPRRAGVSSFGIGGTNVHVVLEEPPPAVASSPGRPWQLLPLSARTDAALDQSCRRLAEHLRRQLGTGLADVAWTLQVGRRPLPVRRFLVAGASEEAAATLDSLDPEQLPRGVCEGGLSGVVFLFPGQGAQHPGMARGLYESEPEFRAQVDEDCELLRPHLGLDLRQAMWSEEEPAAERRLERTWLAQPALFVVEHALARLWMAWGVRPAAMIGHSVGELVAACLSGVFQLQDALALVAERGRLMEAMPPGAMLALPRPEAEVAALLGDELALAAVNGPADCTVAGPEEAVAALARHLAERGVDCRRLHVSHAFHSPLMAGAVEPFARRVAAVPRVSPRLPFLSNLTGTWISADEATDPAYWGRHLGGTVRFGAGVAELLREPGRLLLEVGPGQVLATMVRRHPEHGTVVASMRHRRDPRPDPVVLLQALGRLWLSGVAVDWEAVHAGERRRRVVLPSYPFERQRHWVEPAPAPAAGPVAGGRPAGMDGWFWAPFWRQCPPLPPASDPSDGGRWLVLADGLGVSERLAERLRRAGCSVATAIAGDHFEQVASRCWTVDPRRPADWDSLLDAAGEVPEQVVHTWTLTSDAAPCGLDELQRMEDLAFHSLVHLAQALGRRRSESPVRITIVSNDLHRLPGDRSPRPEKGLLLGPCRVIPQELRGLSCRSLDLSVAASDPGAAAGLVLAEIGAGGDEEVVAWRDGERWIQQFDTVRLEAPSGTGPRLRERGVYLITGGLGGIGLTLAERLVERVRARLVLTGRRGLPPRGEWERWVSERGAADPAGRTIARLLALEDRGGEVMVAVADVTDVGAMAAVIATARARFGGLHGVVHAAGTAGGGVLQLKTAAAAAQVLAPKVRGTLALAQALADGEPPDFVLLCSSINGTIGGFGQVDYCAANAFLDAFARARAGRPGTLWTAVGWDRWREVGMTAATTARAVAFERLHPLLDRCLAATRERAVYATELRPESHWVLAEHLVLGRPTLPGTTYLEMARGAFELAAGAGPLEIREAVFLTPLVVDGGSRAEVLTILDREREDCDVFAFRVVSRQKREVGGAAWVEHARGRIGRATEDTEPRPVALSALEARCGEDLSAAAAERARGLEGFLNTGPRWRSLRSLRTGRGESLAALSLDATVGAEVAELALHPALLDVAAGSVQLRAEGNYLPLAYERLVVRGPLPPELYSHARWRDGNAASDLLTCDLSLLDAAGHEVVAIEGFAMRRVGDEALAQLRGLAGDGAPPAASPDAAAFQALVAGRYEAVDGGIAPQQGAEIFERVLAGSLPQVVVSTRDLMEVMAEARSMDLERVIRDLAGSAANGSAGARTRADLTTATGDELEVRVARVWQRVLGIADIGIHDNFFELGGTSLAGIQLVAELKRELGVDVNAVSIFEAPTVSALARRLRSDEQGTIPFQHARDRARRKQEGLGQRQREALRARRGRLS